MQYERHVWKGGPGAPGQLVLVRPKDVNHALHAILTVFTWLWAIVWITLSVTREAERVTLTVDPHGQVRADRW
ncbi:hypothetical protein OTB20_28585 [Streptomyces sp. H27-H1]|uniref:hypothetical protein n=1 Tax=Streptomyces sp. H27-H1 TaxID=2996461 RepID=UPI002270613A|nr:hypothetical protein [Streptomyces sp. H27-H1]MCY0930079.1 hypothetical protein [Streptomyces sp. H27-H1]